MAKVTFKRYETDAEAQASNVVDGQFIVTNEGTSYIDYGTDRISTNGTPDTAMSDTSKNGVQNKIIKEYVDDSFQEATNYTDNKIADYTTYSTDETVIGTWIDGKPLYRKVVVSNGANGDNVEIPHGISNLKCITKINIIVSNNNGVAYPPMNKTYSLEIYQINSTNIVLNISSAYSTGWYIYYTLEYTKTTD